LQGNFEPQEERMQPRSILRQLSLFGVAIVLFTPIYASAQAGQLDPTFATGGIFEAPTGKSTTNAVAIQSNGKIVVAGAGVFNNAFADMLYRLNTNGTLDTTFGSGGIVNISPPGGQGDGFFGLALQPDGKIVAAAVGLGSLVVVRVESNGTLDSSFGSGGFTSSVFLGEPNFEPNSGGLALESDGKILLVGGVGLGAASLMARFTANGQLDSGFGTGGLISLEYGNPTQVAAQSNGKILVTFGESGTFVFTPLPMAQAGAITRYNSNGAVDTTFAAAGTAASVASASALLLQSDGKIVVAGAITSKLGAAGSVNDVGFGIVRYNPNGTLDGTFGTGGVAITDFGAANPVSGPFAAALQSNGDLVAAGVAGVAASGTLSTAGFGLSRYTSAGQVDTTFGTNGIVVTNIGSDHTSFVNGLAIQSDGKIVVTGTSSFEFDFENGYTARYLSQ
jgi:uncharacterized delta-60 repeat protein